MRALVLATGLVSLALGIATPHPKRMPSTVEKIRAYRTWIAITPSPVNMEPYVAALCIGPQAWDSDPKNPHMPKVFRVFVNPIGERAFRRTMSATNPPKKGFQFPVGTIIVKEKFAKAKTEGRYLVKLKPGAKPELLTVMIKRERGYSPANGDWEYQVMDGAMSRVETRAVQHCQSCHQVQKSKDYVFGQYGTMR